MTKFTASKDTRALHTSPMTATLALAIALTLSGCNMPSPFGTPTGSSMPSGPSGGTPAPSGDSGSDSSSPQGGAPSTSTGNSISTDNSANINTSDIINRTYLNDFKSINFKKLYPSKNLKIYDMRNIFSPLKIKSQGFKYFGIGR